MQRKIWRLIKEETKNSQDIKVITLNIYCTLYNTYVYNTKNYTIIIIILFTKYFYK